MIGCVESKSDILIVSRFECIVPCARQPCRKPEIRVRVALGNIGEVEAEYVILEFDGQLRNA